ncbi:hypothetical protein AB0M71_08390 [Amycolatopsis sp. NPDC051114]|uniref:hypothetical protein n=1 Tax=Amycolatopsis sp. NPDC051114 TaxID=3155280 RepID=UPI00341788CF
MLLLLSSVGLAGVAHASEDSQPVSVEKKSVTTAHFKAGIKKAGASTNSLETDPPGGGCEGRIQFTTTAHYLNGLLTECGVVAFH